MVVVGGNERFKVASLYVTASDEHRSQKVTEKLLGKVRELKKFDFDANFCMLFADADLDHDHILKELGPELNFCKMIGCTTAGEITYDGKKENSVSMFLISSKMTSFFTGVDGEAREKPYEAGKRLASIIIKEKGPIHVDFSVIQREEGLYRLFTKDVMIVLTEGLADQASILRGLTDSLCQVPLIGGGAADKWKFKETKQFMDWKCYTDSVVGAYISSPFAMTFGVAHGWKPFGPPHVITKSHLNILHTLDNTPAAKVYERDLGVDFSQLSEEEERRTLILHPLGISSPEGEYIIRSSRAIRSGGSIYYAAHVPENAVGRLMSGEESSLIDAAGKVVVKAKDKLMKRAREEVVGAVIFDCATRELILGERINDEIMAIKSKLGDVPIAGFFTYGEICPMKGTISDFHNGTIAVLLFTKSEFVIPT